MRRILLLLAVALAPAAWVHAAPPLPPTNVHAEDVRLDDGGRIRVTWEASPNADLTGYQLWRSETDKETASRVTKANEEALRVAYDNAYAEALPRLKSEGEARSRARAAAADLGTPEGAPERGWVLLDTLAPSARSFTTKNLLNDWSYSFVVYAMATGGGGVPIRSVASDVSNEAAPMIGFIDGYRLPLFVILVLLCGTVLFFIVVARQGKPIKIRTIAGLKAVDEAVGRATEMGRPILYIAGIQDMDDLQTVAGVTVLGHVAKTAAEYDARIEVPTSRSLVMSAARETVESSYLSAGRIDSYNADLIYYVTDEQFGFTAYVSGLIVREKPAACFYMGAFFAESLILAETGNSVGAIQIAGTAMPSQLPFFVAACDYTLIGEEFFAASAYLSGKPDQLGSLKGQDMGKVLVAAFLIIGCFFATLAALGVPSTGAVTEFIRTTLLQG